jgi:hypothetical protein
MLSTPTSEGKHRYPIIKPSKRTYRLLFFVGTALLLACSWLEFLNYAQFPYLNLVSGAFLLITLYQLNVHDPIAFQGRPNVPKILVPRLPKLIFALSGLLIYSWSNYVFGVLKSAFQDFGAINLEAMISALLVTIFILFLSRAEESWYFSKIRFASKASENQYKDVFNGAGLICIFLGVGGDLLADSTILTIALMTLKPVVQSERLERRFWVSIWRRRESTVNELVSANAFLYGIIAIGFSFRVLNAQNMLQWVFILFCLTPMAIAYLAHTRGKTSLVIITTQLVSIFCSWVVILTFPSALPLTSYIAAIAAQDFPILPGWVEVLPAYLWIILSLGILAFGGISAARYSAKKNVGGKVLVLELIATLVLLAIISSILEMLLLEKMISSLLINQPLQEGEYQGVFLLYKYMNVQGIIVGAVFLLSLLYAAHETLILREYWQMMRRKRLSINRKRTLILVLITSMFFSAVMVSTDIAMMTLNRSPYYSKGKVTFSESLSYTDIRVVGVTDWISINMTYPKNCTLWAQVLFYNFGYPYERANCTGGQSRIVFEPLFSNDYYLEFGAYNLQENSTVDVSFGIERGRPTILFGGPLLFFPLYNSFLVLPILYVMASSPKETSTKNDVHISEP